MRALKNACVRKSMGSKKECAQKSVRSKMRSLKKACAQKSVNSKKRALKSMWSKNKQITVINVNKKLS